MTNETVLENIRGMISDPSGDEQPDGTYRRAMNLMLKWDGSDGALRNFPPLINNTTVPSYTDNQGAEGTRVGLNDIVATFPVPCSFDGTEDQAILIFGRDTTVSGGNETYTAYTIALQRVTTGETYYIFDSLLSPTNWARRTELSFSGVIDGATYRDADNTYFMWVDAVNPPRYIKLYVNTVYPQGLGENTPSSEPCALYVPNEADCLWLQGLYPGQIISSGGIDGALYEGRYEIAFALHNTLTGQTSGCSLFYQPHYIVEGQGSYDSLSYPPLGPGLVAKKTTNGIYIYTEATPHHGLYNSLILYVLYDDGMTQKLFYSPPSERFWESMDAGEQMRIISIDGFLEGDINSIIAPVANIESAKTISIESSRIIVGNITYSDRIDPVIDGGNYYVVAAGTAVKGNITGTDPNPMVAGNTGNYLWGWGENRGYFRGETYAFYRSFVDKFNNWSAPARYLFPIKNQVGGYNTGNFFGTYLKNWADLSVIDSAYGDFHFPDRDTPLTGIVDGTNLVRFGMGITDTSTPPDWAFGVGIFRAERIKKILGQSPMLDATIIQGGVYRTDNFVNSASAPAQATSWIEYPDKNKGSFDYDGSLDFVTPATIAKANQPIHMLRVGIDWATASFEDYRLWALAEQNGYKNDNGGKVSTSVAYTYPLEALVDGEGVRTFDTTQVASYKAVDLVALKIYNMFRNIEEAPGYTEVTAPENLNSGKSAVIVNVYVPETDSNYATGLGSFSVGDIPGAVNVNVPPGEDEFSGSGNISQATILAKGRPATAYRFAITSEGLYDLGSIKLEGGLDDLRAQQMIPQKAPLNNNEPFWEAYNVYYAGGVTDQKALLIETSEPIVSMPAVNFFYPPTIAYVAGTFDEDGGPVNAGVGPVLATYANVNDMSEMETSTSYNFSDIGKNVVMPIVNILANTNDLRYGDPRERSNPVMWTGAFTEYTDEVPATTFSGTVWGGDCVITRHTFCVRDNAPRRVNVKSPDWALGGVDSRAATYSFQTTSAAFEKAPDSALLTNLNKTGSFEQFVEIVDHWVESEIYSPYIYRSKTQYPGGVTGTDPDMTDIGAGPTYPLWSYPDSGSYTRYIGGWDYLLNPAFVGGSYPSKLFPATKADRIATNLPTRIHWSLPQVQGDPFFTMGKFLTGDYVDLTGDPSPISKIVRRQNESQVVMQEDAVAVMYFNKTLTQDANGVIQSLRSGDFVGYIQWLSRSEGGDYGVQSTACAMIAEDMVFGFDVKRRKMFSFPAKDMSDGRVAKLVFGEVIPSASMWDDIRASVNDRVAFVFHDQGMGRIGFFRNNTVTDLVSYSNMGITYVPQRNSWESLIQVPNGSNPKLINWFGAAGVSFLAYSVLSEAGTEREGRIMTIDYENVTAGDFAYFEGELMDTNVDLVVRNPRNISKQISTVALLTGSQLASTVSVTNPEGVVGSTTNNVLRNGWMLFNEFLGVSSERIRGTFLTIRAEFATTALVDLRAIRAVTRILKRM